MNNAITIKKISIREIEEFIASDFFKQLEIKPISPNRAISYIKNPRSKDDDNVIYMLLLENKLVCFRTVLPDLIKQGDKTERFVWLSGNFTHPKHRCKGYSKVLLDEIYKDHNGKLMYTNYAIESHYLYTESGKFNALTERTGKRFYGNINIATYLRNRNLLYRVIIPFAHVFINVSTFLKRLSYKIDKSIKVTHYSHQFPADFVKNICNENNLFGRYEKEFDWILSYPWLTQDKKFKNFSYPFSFYTKNYKYHFVEVEKDSRKAYLMLLEKEKNIKVTYLQYSNIQLAAKAILDICYNSRAKTLTTLDSKLSKELNSTKTPFINSKAFTMGIYTSFEIKNAEQFQFQDGDGDNVFT